MPLGLMGEIIVPGPQGPENTRPPRHLSLRGAQWGGPLSSQLTSPIGTPPAPQEAGLLGQPRSSFPALPAPQGFPVWETGLDPTW